MAPTTDLLKVGIEAFALLEESNMGRNTRPPPYPYQPTTNTTLHTREVIDCYQAAQMCGGVLIVDCRNKKSLPALRKVN